jgi:hypothetical protein
MKTQMLTDFDDPVTLGVSLDIHDPVLATDIKKILVDLAVDLGMSGVVCVNSAPDTPRNQGESVNGISLYSPPVLRHPTQVETDLKRVINMVNECVSENKYVLFLTDSFKTADFYRINKCFRLAERSDFEGSLYFFGFNTADAPGPMDDCEYHHFKSVEEFGDHLKEIVSG